MALYLPNSQRRISRWKNGGGCTAEIAIAPNGAGLDDFDWRISMATISQAGDFSVFPGIDRTLMLLAGNGVALQVDQAPPFKLDLGQPLIRFPGEAAVRASISDGPCTDFNVMTRRGACRHRFETRSFIGQHSLTRRGANTLLFLAGGAPVHCLCGHTARRLNQHDALLLSADDDATLTLRARTTATLFIVEIMPATTNATNATNATIKTITPPETMTSS